MESKRLIAFGCSLTFGHGLPDHTDDSRKPSKFAWPQILADLLKRKCVNISDLGNSNKEIWHDAVSFDFLESDIVFINWSYIERFCIFELVKPEESDKEYFQHRFFAGNHGHGLSLFSNKMFYKYFYSTYDLYHDTSIRMRDISSYLSELNIEHYFMPPPGWNQLHKRFVKKTMKQHNSWYKKLPIIFKNIGEGNIESVNCDLAKDGIHPGVLSNQRYAEALQEARCKLHRR
jgi:hypothetical protein